MKQNLILALLLCLGLTGWTQSPIGKWKTIDDVTGKPKSVVELYNYNGEVHGRIVELIREPDEDQDPVCDKCTGDKYNKKIKGMTIVWGLKQNGSSWENGSILDPKNGKVYRCYITPEGNDKLKVRGYVGFSMIGRTQYWYKQ